MRSTYAKRISRNIGVISKKEQKTLRKARVAVIGLGGIGGIAFDLLVRSGVGQFVIVDKDRFEETNLNRQLLSTTRSIGKQKIAVACKRAKEINPEVKINANGAELDEKNAKQMLRGIDIVIDGLDSAFSRVVLSRAARSAGIPYVFGAASGATGMSSVFVNESYEKTLALPSDGKDISAAKKILTKYPSGKPILGVAASTVGVFQATQALCVILKKPYIRAPKIAFFDVLGKEKFVIRKLR